VDAQLVPGDRLRRDDHGVATLDRDRRVVVEGDARQRRERLALAAGAEHEHLVVAVLLEVGRLDQRPLGHVDVAQVPRDVDVLAHRAADDANLAPGLHGDVHRLLHPVDVRRERRDENPAGADRDDLAERLADDALGQCVAGLLGVRGVAEQEVDALAADLRQAPHVGAQAVHGRVVELVVAGHHDAAARGLEHDRDRVGDRVRHAHELQPERPQLDGRPVRVDLAQLRGAQEPVLVELRLDQPERQARRQDLGRAHLTHQVREPADVVLVPVREDDGEDVVAPLAEVRVVRQDEVDAQVLVAREREAGVDDDDRALGLEGGHVLPHLAEAAERDDAHRVGHA
jgi:hypothetical protein